MMRAVYVLVFHQLWQDSKQTASREKKEKQILLNFQVSIYLTVGIGWKKSA